MARRKRPHKTSPKTPSRVKKRRAAKKPRAHAAHHHPELIGLGLAGLGVFLAAVLWFGFSGGPVAHIVKSGVGAAAYLAPLVFVPLGGLIVTRSALIDVRPFRLGLAIAVVGVLLTLGRRTAALPAAASSRSSRSASARPARPSSASCSRSRARCS